MIFNDASLALNEHQCDEVIKNFLAQIPSCIKLYSCRFQKFSWHDVKIKNRQKLSKNNEHQKSKLHVLTWKLKDQLYHLSFFMVEKKSSAHLKLIKLNLQLALLNSIQQVQQQHMEQLIFQDDLTCLYNYRKLYADLDQLITIDQKIFSLVFFDLDNFKSINDQHGHLVGSALLKYFAIQFRDVMSQDMVVHKNNVLLYRYGGDEFICLLVGVSAAQAKNLLEKAQLHLQNIPMKINEELFLPIKLSMGIAEFPRDGQNKEAIIEVADKMMYCAKKQDGKKIVASDSFAKKILEKKILVEKILHHKIIQKKNDLKKNRKVA